MSKTTTLAELRAEAERVYGVDTLSVLEVDACHTTGRAIILFLSGRRRVCFEGRSKAAARRLALETLARMPSWEAPW